MLILALGGDEKLNTLAVAELAEKPDALALGNAWWDYAEAVEGRLQAAASQRAVAWYKHALPGVVGLSKKVDSAGKIGLQMQGKTRVLFKEISIAMLP